jgi:hypothetical protein
MVRPRHRSILASAPPPSPGAVASAAASVAGAGITVTRTAAPPHLVVVAVRAGTHQQGQSHEDHATRHRQQSYINEHGELMKSNQRARR